MTTPAGGKKLPTRQARLPNRFRSGDGLNLLQDGVVSNSVGISLSDTKPINGPRDSELAIVL